MAAPDRAPRDDSAAAVTNSKCGVRIYIAFSSVFVVPHSFFVQWSRRNEISILLKESEKVRQTEKNYIFICRKFILFYSVRFRYSGGCFKFFFLCVSEVCAQYRLVLFRQYSPRNHSNKNQKFSKRNNIRLETKFKFFELSYCVD